MALKYEPDTAIVASGALAALSYEKTGVRAVTKDFQIDFSLSVHV
jgi:hypothetical protein